MMKLTASVKKSKANALVKGFLLVIFAVFFIWVPLFPGGDSHDSTEAFWLQGNVPVRVSIDKGWERNGWIPVVLSVGNLELYFRMNKAGEVVGTAWQVDPETGEIWVGGTHLTFAIYQQNPARTRMRLIDDGLPLLLEIDWQKQEAVLYIGNSRWKVAHIPVRREEASPGGLYRLTFGGRAVYTHKRLVLEPSGTIYGDVDQTLVWAVKIHKEELRGIIQGGLK